MKRAWLLSLAGTSLSLLANHGAVAKERGYAVWNAASAVTSGTEVAVKDGDFVERAFLRPAAAVRTLTPLMDLDKGRVILPAGGVLALMSGGRSGEYCTWNHGIALAPPKRRARLRLTDKGGLLCLSVDSAKNTNRVHYVSGNNALLLREYGIDLAGGAKRIGAVTIESIAPDQYPGDVEVGPVAFMMRRGGEKLPCMRWGARATDGVLDVFSVGDACFKGIGQSIELESGRYTLLQWNEKTKSFAIRVDRPFQLNDFTPRIFERVTVTVI